MIEYVVYGEESGEIKSFKTLKQAQEFIKSLVESDKRFGFKDKYYIEEINWNE